MNQVHLVQSFRDAAKMNAVMIVTHGGQPEGQQQQRGRERPVNVAGEVEHAGGSGLSKRHRHVGGQCHQALASRHGKVGAGRDDRHHAVQHGVKAFGVGSSLADGQDEQATSQHDDRGHPEDLVRGHGSSCREASKNALPAKFPCRQRVSEAADRCGRTMLSALCKAASRGFVADAGPYVAAAVADVFERRREIEAIPVPRADRSGAGAGFGHNAGTQPSRTSP